MQYLEKINQFIWGIPALLMILGTGVYLSLRTGFAQIRLFPRAVRRFLEQLRKKDSQYRSLCTALAATVGTGNIIGVAGAIVIGGPGAIFWMWACALLGMVTKFAEATLAVRYREKNLRGEYVGGPMYMIRNGLGRKWNWLAGTYCVFGVAASFGVGNAAQVNAFVVGVNTALSGCGIQPTQAGNIIMGIGLAVVVAAVLLGGARRIGDAAQKLVPFASIGYIVLCCFVLCLHYDRIPGAVRLIFAGAFSPRAATGGLLGSAFTALRIGASRGTFTNEAGMGTASIAHAGADVCHPVEQGLMGIMEVFLDTILICTMTALVILCSGLGIPYGTDAGGSQTAQAFAYALGDWTVIPLMLAVCCFAVATIFGWSLYGGRCAQYLFGEKSWKYFVYAQAGTVVLSAVADTEAIWLLSEILNGLMALPNLIALIALSPELVCLVRNYKTGA